MEATGQYCLDKPGLSCRLTSQNDSAMTEVDARLEVTWSGSMVITEGTYLPQPEQQMNGDHDFMCSAVLKNMSSTNSPSIGSPITIRGIRALLQDVLLPIFSLFNKF